MSARRHPAPRLLGIVAIVFAGVIVTIAQLSGDATSPARRTMYLARLPEGAGQTIAQRSCVMCHSAMLITQQHKDSTGWEKTVKQMETWGAPVAHAERETLLAYLRRHFGAEKR